MMDRGGGLAERPGYLGRHLKGGLLVAEESHPLVGGCRELLCELRGAICSSADMYGCVCR